MWDPLRKRVLLSTLMVTFVCKKSLVCLHFLCFLSFIFNHHQSHHHQCHHHPHWIFSLYLYLCVGVNCKILVFLCLHFLCAALLQVGTNNCTKGTGPKVDVCCAVLIKLSERWENWKWDRDLGGLIMFFKTYFKCVFFFYLTCIS